jgi:hypothetical protein
VARLVLTGTLVVMASSQMLTAWDSDISVIVVPDAGLTVAGLAAAGLAVAGLAVAGAGVAVGPAVGVWAWAYPEPRARQAADKAGRSR